MQDDDGARRSQLLAVKLRVLVSEHEGRTVDAEPSGFPGGAAMIVDRTAWILADDAGDPVLGAALGWAVRHGAEALALITERGGGVAARQATAFRLPISVWYPEERTLLPVPAEPLAAAPDASAEHRAFIPMIEEAGAEPNIEHGVVSGEVRGLEVCRVVDEATVGHFAELSDTGLAVPPTVIPADRDLPGVRLEVGVGDNDREAFQLIHGDVPTIEALTTVVDTVRAHRSPDVPLHPLNRLGRERYLRWMAEQEPSLVGAATMRRAEPPSPRRNLKDPVPCMARGTRDDGSPVTAVFSSGVDLDVVPFVADVQLSDPSPVVIALPSRDLVALTRELAALLVTPVEFAPLD